jgi:hypothetical protein
MSDYGAIALSDPDHDGKGGPDDCTQRQKPAGRLSESSKLKFKINPESVRFTAYCFFWSMCFFAIAMTKLVVRAALLDGPKIAGSTCPPFDAFEGGVDRSMGFDVNTESHLMENFGFNNVSKIYFQVRVEIASSN